MRHRRLRTRLLRRAIGPRWGLLHDDGGHLGGLRRRGSWETGRRRRRGGGGRGGRRFDRSGGGVAEQGDAEHGRSDGRGDRRQTEQHQWATPRRLCVLPFLVAEVHLGPGVGHVAVGQYVLAGVVFGPRQCRRGVRGRNRCGGGGSSGRRRRQRGGRVDDPAPVGDERRALGRGELWVRRGHDGCAQVLGEPLGDQRNAGTTADGGDRRDARRRHSVALERFVKHRKEFRERRSHQDFEFGACDADIGAVAG